MRGPNDLVTVRVTTTRELTLDLEQLEASPLFNSVLDTLRINSPQPEAITPEFIVKAVKQYVLHYIGVDAFPHRTPGTTGPGNIYQVNVEVPNEHGNQQSDEECNSNDTKGDGDSTA